MDRPPTALLDLAATALRAGDAGTAERYSRQAIGSAPANELAWLSLITAITSQGRDTATIIDTYQSALVVAGFAPTIRVAYAKLLNASGRRKDAQKVISEGLALGESDELRRAAASYSAP
jgi:Tfp pilus assembly protein PilF